MEPLVHRPYKRKAKAIITERKSVQLVYKLMRISFNVAAYLRGIFPGNYFKTQTYQGTKYQEFRSNIRNEEVQTYQDWTEKGVKDALSKGYLDKCLLEIYRKKKGGTYEINELYTFHVRYTEEGAELYLSQSGSSSQSVTAQTMKNDTKQVLTTLVDMTRGLGPLPVARMVTMRLLYNEKAPDDYEAPGFLATKEHERLMMRSEPKKMSCGTLSTPHHEADLFVLLNEEAKKQEKSETEEDPDDIFKDLPGIEDDPVTQRHKQLSMKRKTIENSDDDDFMDVPPARVAKPTKLPARKNSGTAKARKSSTSKKRKVNNMSGVDDGALRAEVKSNPRGSGQVQRKLRGGSSKRGGASRTRNSARNGEHAPSQAPTVTLWRAIPTDGAEGIVQERIFQD